MLRDSSKVSTLMLTAEKLSTFITMTIFFFLWNTHFSFLLFSIKIDRGNKRWYIICYSYISCSTTRVPTNLWLYHYIPIYLSLGGLWFDFTMFLNKLSGYRDGECPLLSKAWKDAVTKQRIFTQRTTVPRDSWCIGYYNRSRALLSNNVGNIEYILALYL